MRKFFYTIILFLVLTATCYAEIYLDQSNRGGQGNKTFKICATTIGWNNTDCWYDATIEGFTEHHLFLVIKRPDGKLVFISTNMNIVIKER